MRIFWHSFKNHIFCVFVILFCFSSFPALAWKNGPPNNKVTNSDKDCVNPPYSTHDWIVDQARLMLPSEAREWLDRHRTLLLIGTEAPDYNKIPLACGIPNQGYDDNGGGRHDLRFSRDGKVKNDRPAVRAREEFEKAQDAYRNGAFGYAAYYLGAAAHYIGDLSQYGHTIKGEGHHADFEEWVGSMTPSLNGGVVFEKFINPEVLIPVTAYEAVIQTGMFTYAGNAPVLRPEDLDKRYSPNMTSDPEIITSIGHTLNKAVNATARMLYGFYLTEIKS